MKKINTHIVMSLAGLVFVTILLACFTACSKDEGITGGQGVDPNIGEPAVTDKTVGTVYNISVSATHSNGANTRAVVFTNGLPVSSFNVDDNIYIYNKTKSAWGYFNGGSRTIAILHPEEDNSANAPSPWKLTAENILFSQSVDGELLVINQGDEIHLYYNFNGNPVTENNYCFNYKDQAGTVAYCSSHDFAEAVMKVKSLSGNVDEGYNIELCTTDVEDLNENLAIDTSNDTEAVQSEKKRKKTAQFENLQSLYKFYFPVLANGVKSLKISLPHNKFITYFDPNNPLLKESSNDVTITLNSSARTANGKGIVYAALRFETEGVTQIDDVVFEVTENNVDQTKYVYTRHMPNGGFGNHNFYDLVFEAPAASTDLSSVSVVENVYTAKRGEVLTGTLDNSYSLAIPDGATVALNNATINAVTCEGNATIVLADGSTNSVSSITAPYDEYSSSILTIKGTYAGTGSLNVTSIDCGNAEFGNATVTVASGINGNVAISSGSLTVTGVANKAGVTGAVSATGGVLTATGGGGEGDGLKGISGTVTVGSGLMMYEGDAANPSEAAASQTACAKQYVVIKATVTP